MPYPMKQYEVLSWASSFLKKHGREENIAEILLQHHLNLSRSAFFMQMREPVTEHVWDAYREDVEKHAQTGMPVQHIIGTAPFYGRDFQVSPEVLIPRFETEELMEHMLAHIQNIPDKTGLVVVDVGTGSGIIAITLKLEVPELTVYATDISEEALKVARANAEHLGADIQFLQGNFITPFIKQQLSADILVSNPPYIKYSDKEILADTVKDYDPSLALYAAEEGLAAYREIITQTTELNPERLESLFFEIGYEQAADVNAMIKATYNQSIVETYQDMNGKDRIIAAKLRQMV